MTSNYISTKQLAPKLSISVAEIRDCCELLGNPVIQQENDREVVPDFTMPNGETISAEQFFNMLLQAAPVKDGKKDVLTAAIALKEKIEQANNKNQQTEPGNPTSQLPESKRLEFLEFVSARTGVPVSQVENLGHQTLEGQLVNYLKHSPDIAAQIHHTMLEFIAVQVEDRLKNGTPTDPRLLSRAEKEGLGKSKNGEVHNPTEMVALSSVEQAMSGFANFINFSTPVHQPTFVSHLALEASPTSPALPPEK